MNIKDIKEIIVEEGDDANNNICNTTKSEVKESKGNKPKVIGENKERDEKGRFLKRPKGAGRKKGSVSLLTDIKIELKRMAKKNPGEYKQLIRDYIDDKKKRELLIKMIDGLPTQKIGGDKDNPIEFEVKSDQLTKIAQEILTRKKDG